MEVKDIRQLLRAVTESDVNELVLETGDYKLSIKRGAEQVLSVVPAAPAAPAAAQVAPVQAALSAPASEAPAAPPPANPNFVEVSAPIVGTFYSSPSPDAPSFVKVGDRVKPGTVLCIIEAMKLMNEIEAEVAGVVREVAVSNEDPVEYGQVLFRIEPD